MNGWLIRANGRKWTGGNGIPCPNSSGLRHWHCPETSLSLSWHVNYAKMKDESWKEGHPIKVRCFQCDCVIGEWYEQMTGVE